MCYDKTVEALMSLHKRAEEWSEELISYNSDNTIIIISIKMYSTDYSDN